MEKEVAVALREPIGAAQTRIWQAKRLMRMLPKVWRALSAGDVPERHVSKLIDAAAGVDDPQLMAEVEDRVLAPTRRTKQARDQADVAFYPGEDGMGDVVVHAPVEDAAIVKTAVDAYAAAAKSCGDERPIGVPRAEAAVTWASSYLTGLADGHVPRAAGRPIEVRITIGVRTALGLDDLPGELPGLGVIPREVIAAMIRAEPPKLRLMVLDEDGRTAGLPGRELLPAHRRPGCTDPRHLRVLGRPRQSDPRRPHRH